MKMTKVQTGGKLYIAGEYAVLTPGQTAIIKNIPIHMTAVVKENSTIKLFLICLITQLCLKIKLYFNSGKCSDFG